MRIIHGTEIKNHIETLGRFRIEIFREYPYLYEGSLEYERKYLSRYSRNPNSILVMIPDEKGLVGACTGVPLLEESQEFKALFAGESLHEIYYIGEVMVRANARGKGIGTKLLATALSAIDPEKYKTICLAAVDRGNNHPSCPKQYAAPDSLWRKFGFEKHEHLVVTFTWKDVGDVVETEKPMQVWVKKF
ncbi:MAG: GNAT family N-acetyltransferase [Gammaproteobacteria bacterium]|nr:GNAT family N-acetyltransferase [Gammaproteobacteria bacterium]